MTGTLNGTSKAKSLDEFMADRAPRRWADTLPAEVVAEIKASTASGANVLLWLDSIGIEGGTSNKIADLLRALR